MSTSVKPIPEGMRTLTPHLICAGAAAAIDFYKRAFNASEQFRLAMPDGRLAHACLVIGDSTLMLVDEMPEHGALGPKVLKGTPVCLHLYVPDTDAAIAKAVAAGATVTIPAADMFWGDRYGQVEDPFGHRWSLATHQRDLTPEQIAEAMASAPPCGS
ncbi:VOC family protein [Burkholderia cepacia]|uniref:VOC family protein n=1 Tax=Burkholderia cepacia TaxID=292 RepID=UPI001C97ACE3|nr:VOC family protein [Burkholderia cepacia]MBY4799867.1 VOC family protein [Burkholderia cepacia]MCA8328820.1 VOC family protein [Burkholderia cepacia]